MEEKSYRVTMINGKEYTIHSDMELNPLIEYIYKLDFIPDVKGNALRVQYIVSIEVY